MYCAHRPCHCQRRVHLHKKKKNYRSTGFPRTRATPFRFYSRVHRRLISPSRLTPTPAPFGALNRITRVHCTVDIVKLSQGMKLDFSRAEQKYSVGVLLPVRAVSETCVLSVHPSPSSPFFLISIDSAHRRPRPVIIILV